MNDTLKVLEKRRSCRNFKSDMIPEETLEQIVRNSIVFSFPITYYSPLRSIS